MQQKILIYESDYLAYELMPISNMDFVTSEFAHIEGLINRESEWESNPEWTDYLAERPLGDKPYKIEIRKSELCDLLLRNNLSQVSDVEIIADERGVYADEIKTATIFANDRYAIVFPGQHDIVDYLCVIPSDPDGDSIAEQLRTFVRFILDAYNLMIVNWIDRKVN